MGRRFFPLVIFAVLDEDGGPTRGDPAHDHPKNFGATHFIIGRDMAGTKSTVTGDDFYGAYDAQETGKKYSAELGVTVTHYENMVYVGADEGYVQESEAKKRGLKVVKLSGTEFRRRLRADEEIPEWFAFKSVVDILRKAGDRAFC